MQTSDYNKIEIDQFNGLYKRGRSDQTPPDHAICCDNCEFRKPGQVSSRGGSKMSLVLDHPVRKHFLATFDNDTFVYLHIDYAGNLYQGNNPTPLANIPNMIGFSAINLFNRCYILPLLSTLGSATKLKVWRGPGFALRDALGVKPTGTIVAANGAAGKLDPGIHKFTVCFETDTGFITPPNTTIISYTAPGALKVDLSSIPTGPSTTVARHILATRGNEEDFFFPPGGRIGNNTATTLTLDFYDSDLSISADYLFDLLEFLPGASISAALFKFHGRLLSTAEGDLVRVSRSGDAESFSNVDGFIQMPSENDGNTTRSLCLLRDTLYLFKSVGAFATEDNGDVPSSWRVTQIDGTRGAYQDSISTVTGSQPALPDRGFTVANRAGLFLFEGIFGDRPLTWKVDDVWQRLTHGAEFNISVIIDAFKQEMYVLLPVDGSVEPNLLLLGDFTSGLDWKSLKWSLWYFSFTPSCIMMGNFSDDAGFGDYDYYLRLGSAEIDGVIKQRRGLKNDLGEAIVAYYQPGPVTFERGALNIFRGYRTRAWGDGALQFDLWDEDLVNKVTPLFFTLSERPGYDHFRQINKMNEKAIFKFGVNILDNYFTVDRLDIYGKALYGARPA